MKKVVVTGGTGRLGAYVVEHFLESGYDVLNVDTAAPKETKARFQYVDLTNLGECYGAFAGADAVVHLAAIPVAFRYPNEVTFRNNVMAAYNVLEAAAGFGIQKLVLASSESSYGIVYAKDRLVPKYVPMDEDHPQLPEDCYGLSKVVMEKAAEAFHRRTGMQVVSFRLGNVISEAKYREFPGFIHNIPQRQRLLWSYIDARDAAVACRLAIEKDGLGAVVLNLAADDTSMDVRSIDLMKACYPEVTDIRVPLDNFHTLLANDRAKQVLGWQPVHFWRDNVRL